jgi:hypothetical protein
MRYRGERDHSHERDSKPKPRSGTKFDARARARGVSLDEYLQELVAREAGLSGDAEQSPKQFDNLSDLLLNSPFAGANLDLERPKDYPRPVDLE